MSVSVCFDVNVFVGAVQRHKAAPTVDRVGASTPEGMMLLYAANNRNIRLHFGDHIAEQIVRTLTGKYGWDPDEARKWADRCRELAAKTGGRTDIPVESDETKFARFYGVYGVPDREDAQVINITQAARVDVLITSDKELQGAKVPGLEIVDPQQLAAQLRAAYEADRAQSRTNMPDAA